MYNLTEQEIQELLEMGIDPSSVVSAYDQANFGTFVNNTVGNIKNFVTGTPAVNPAAPSQGGTAFSLAGGSGSSVFNTGAPLQVQRPTQPTQYTMTPNNAPTVSTPTGTPSLMQRLSSGVETAFDKLEDKYKDKIVDKDGKAQAFKFLDKPMQGLMAGLSYGKSMNDAAQVQEQNRMANQSPFREAGNTKEYYNNDFVGENDPLYFLNSRDGAKAETQQMYAAGGVPIEAEGGEFYLDPSTGATIPIHGPSHEEGGVKMVAKSGSYIMSDNVKIPGSYVNDMLKKNVLSDKKQYTISDVIRQFPQHFDTKGDAEKLDDKTLDPISKNSFEMNMKKKLGNVSKLLAYQQQMNGGHGEDNGPEARYGMEINGGAPLSFDYRPDELRVKDMMEMQQMPMAKEGTKNTTPKFKTKEEADAYYANKATSATLDQKAAYQQWYLNEAKKLKPGETLDVVAPENLGPYAGLKYQVKADDLTRYNDQQGQNYMPTGYGLDAKGTYILPNLNAFQSQWQSQNSATGYGGIDWSPGSAQWSDFTRRHPEIASKYEGKLNDPNQMSAMQQDLIKKLVDHGADIPPEMMKGLADVKGGRMTWSVPSFVSPTTPPKTPPTTPPPTIPPIGPPVTPPKKTPPYKERLPFGQYMGLLPSPRTQNYLPQYREERYEPNLVSLRSAKNDQTAAMNSMLQQQGMNPATMAARQASLYGEAAKNIAGITEQENNANAQILNQAKAQNAQIGNQFNQMQEAANKQYVTENAQDLAALDADRYKKLTDLYSAQQKVNQYNKTLQFIDDTVGKNYNYGVDKDGNVTIARNENAAIYNSNDAAANLRAMQQAVSPQQPSSTQQNTQQQTTTPGGRYGRKNLK